MGPRHFAPWHALLADHLASNPPSFTLSTYDASQSAPRCRTMIFRGFLGTPPPNNHNPLLDHNPRCYTSSLPTFTTDARSHKLYEVGIGRDLIAMGGGPGDGTGKGGNVEMCFWFAGNNNQWRISGPVYLLSEHNQNGSEELEKCLLETGEDADKTSEWTWRKLVEQQFANLSPQMRGSFISPVPGTERSRGVSEGTKRGVRIEDDVVLSKGGWTEKAMGNFRVGVVVPKRVERVDLGAEEGLGRKWIWELEGCEWKEMEVWA